MQVLVCSGFLFTRKNSRAELYWKTRGGGLGSPPDEERIAELVQPQSDVDNKVDGNNFKPPFGKNEEKEYQNDFEGVNVAKRELENTKSGSSFSPWNRGKSKHYIEGK